MTRPLAPSQQLAVLAILTHDSEAAFAFGPMPDRAPLWSALDDGPPRQLAALLAYWFATVEQRGLGVIFGTAKEFGPALDFARHAASDAETRAALAGDVDYRTIRDLCRRAASECEAVREEGEALVWQMVEAAATAATRPITRRRARAESVNRAATRAWLDETRPVPALTTAEGTPDAA